MQEKKITVLGRLTDSAVELFESILISPTLVRIPLLLWFHVRVQHNLTTIWPLTCQVEFDSLFEVSPCIKDSALFLDFHLSGSLQNLVGSRFRVSIPKETNYRRIRNLFFIFNISHSSEAPTSKWGPWPSTTKAKHTFRGNITYYLN